MKTSIVLAVRVWPVQSKRGWAYQRDEANEPSYLVDTCAGGSWSKWAEDAKTWRHETELVDELAAAELVGNFEIVRIVEVRE